MNKIVFVSLSMTVLLLSKACTVHTPALSPDLYDTASWEHADSLGNHRVVLNVDKQADAVLADILWRMRKIGPDKKNVIVVDATTNERITNIFPYEISNERGKFAFQPVTVPGRYYVYYLTRKSEGRMWYPTITYYPFEDTSDPGWVTDNELIIEGTEGVLPQAEVLQFQAANLVNDYYVGDINSFYPMGVMATAAEVEELIADNIQRDYMLFTEDRRYPIRSNHYIPNKWIEEGAIGSFNGTTDQGEYYTFQLGLYAFKNAVENIRVRFGNLVHSETGSVIPVRNFTCFNTEGIDVTGNYFEKSFSAPAGELRPIWIGVEIPERINPGNYTGNLYIEADGLDTNPVALNITVTENTAVNMGDNEIWKHSRMRWLNSTIGTDDFIPSPFIPLRLNRDKKSINCLGRTVQLGDNGLPSQIISWFSERLTEMTPEGTEMLDSPVRYIIESEDRSEWEVLNFEFTRVTPGTVGWKTLSRNNSFIMELNAEMDFDGNMNYAVTLVSVTDIAVNDIALEFPLRSELGKYMMGLGEVGGYLKDDIYWKWAVEKNQDGPWVGKENAGLQCRFMDINYERPLNTNFYQLQPLNMPVSWYNDGSGGINIKRGESRVTIRSYSGHRNIKKGDIFHFNFNIAITPFKTIDTDKQWSHRFYHRPNDLDSIANLGANTVNIHHANYLNPYINYPFLTPDLMKDYIDKAHSKDMKVKFYYTLRELTNRCPEIFALRSLGDEIFSEGDAGGYSWLQEHLDQNYIAAWYSPMVVDPSIINSGVSRWHNYYVEGLNWLVENLKIDGLYIDDLAFDRVTMKRVRQVLERGNPNTFIDLHSANQFNPRDGFANSANLYLEHFPFIDRLWFGEYFDYDKRPDFWMVEVAGIPYGLMGEMLQDGGNPWRGMLYGMTARLPWRDAEVVRPIWNLWDNFGIEKSEMIGYWVSDHPVKTHSENTLATAYVRKGLKTLVSLGTWAEEGEQVKLLINWDELGLDPDKAVFHAPAIDGFQDEQSWHPDDLIDAPAGKGFLIIISNKE